MQAAPGHAGGNRVALRDDAFDGGVHFAEGGVKRLGMRDHVIGGHGGVRGMIEEIGCHLGADRVGIVTVGDGVVVGEDERFIGFERHDGHWDFHFRK